MPLKSQRKAEFTEEEQKKRCSEIGQRINEIRKARGISLTTLGSYFGLSYQQMQKNSTGINRFPLERLEFLSKKWNVPIDEFFKGSTINCYDSKIKDKEIIKINNLLSKLDKEQHSIIKKLLLTMTKDK